MRQIPMMVAAMLLCLGLILASAILAQDGDNGEEHEHEEENGQHDTNETHYEEHHDPWPNLYAVSIVVVVFACAIVIWPRK